MVFLETRLGWVRHMVGAQPDLLAPVVVYAALYTGLSTTAATVILGGLAQDAVSSAPLGLSILPLGLVGVLLHWRRDVLLRDSAWAQASLGAAAPPLVSVLSLVFLFVFWPLVSSPGGDSAPHFFEMRAAGHSVLPRVGWGWVWQLGVLAAFGSVATPIVFRLFRWVEDTFHYRPAPRAGYRADREIQRGRF